MDPPLGSATDSCWTRLLSNLYNTPFPLSPTSTWPLELTVTSVARVKVGDWASHSKDKRPVTGILVQKILVLGTIIFAESFGPHRPLRSRNQRSNGKGNSRFPNHQIFPYTFPSMWHWLTHLLNLVPAPKSRLYVVDNINLRLHPPFVFI